MQQYMCSMLPLLISVPLLFGELTGKVGAGVLPLLSPKAPPHLVLSVLTAL